MTNSLVAHYERDAGICTTIDGATRAARGAATARALELVGVRPRDTVQVTQTIDASGAAWPVLWALDQLDAVVVATSGLRATPALRQLEFLRRFGVTTLCADDATVTALDEAAQDEGCQTSTLAVRRIVLTDRSLPGVRRREIERRWNASVFCAYASRSAPSWAAAECEASRRSGGSLGLHVLDDAVLGEIEQHARLLTDECPCGLAGPRAKFESEE